MSVEILKTYLRRFVMTGLYVVLLMPFFYYKRLLYPFITGKIFVFQIIIELIFVAYIILMLIDKSVRPRRSWLLIVVSIYVLSGILSTILGVDLERSFWGNYERLSGIFTQLHFFVFFLILGSMLGSRDDWHRYLIFALVVSTAEAIFSIVQYSSVNLLFARGGGRVWGTLGNFIYIATYSIFHIFIGLLLLVDRVHTKTILKKLFLGAAIFLNFMALYLSGTRGGYLGFLVGILVTALLSVLTAKSKKVKIMMFLGLIGFLLLGAVIVKLRAHPVVKSLPMVGPLINTDISRDTASTRLMAWKIALQSIKEKPVFGWGPENFYYAFNKYLDPRFLEKGGYYETWFDRPHNVVLEVLATRGLLGVVAYLAIFFSVIIYSWIHFKKREMRGHELILLIGLLSAYFIQNLFAFDQPTSFLLFYLVLGWLQSNYQIARKDHTLVIERERQLGPAYYLLTLLFFVSVSYPIYLFNVKPLMGAKATVDAEIKMSKNFEEGFGLYQKAALIKSPYRDDIQSLFSRKIHDQLFISQEFAKANENRLREMIQMLEDLLRAHPNDVLTLMTLSQFYVVIGQVDPEYLTRADQVIERAVLLSPARQQVYYLWFRIKMAKAEYEGARKILHKVVKFSPGASETYWYLGLLEDTTSNKKEKVLEYMEEALAKGFRWRTLNEILLMARVADQAGHSQRVVELLQVALSRAKRADLYVMLSKAYAKIGETGEARKALERAIDLDPKITDKIKKSTQ